MEGSMTKPRVGLGITVALLAAALVYATAGAAGVQQASQQKLVKINMGTEPWIGYGPWWIAQKKGFFQKHGLKVNIVNFQTDGDRDSALIAGRTDVSNEPTNGIIRFDSTGKADLKALIFEDASLGADAVLAKKGINTPKQLIGKTVAYEQGTTSDLLIHYLLQANHIPFSKIKVVNAPAANAGTLLIAGKVDVAVTYEPYISNATSGAGGAKGVHVLYSSKEAPGLISDYLAATSKWLATHKSVVKALVAAWNDSMNYFKTNRADAIAIMAAGVGSKPADLTSTLAGVKLYTIPENKQLFAAGALKKQYNGIGKAMTAQGVIKTLTPFASVVDLSAQK
jgi:NitT/TauT family transport system substrate-binding protein